MKFGNKSSSNLSFLLSMLLLLGGCGGGGVRPVHPSSAPVPGPPSDPPELGQNITGNWQFSTTSTAGMPSLTIAASIIQSGSAVTGEVHVDGSSCFDQRTAITLTGTLSNGNISLTSTAFNGQVITLSGIEKIGSPDTLTGTYTINGGCADGDQGNSTGYNVISLAGYWAGSLTTAGGQTIYWDTQLNQDSPTAEGSFGLNGTFTFDGCFASGTATSGTFPSASYILGTAVALDINTGNGKMAFVGTMEPYGLIEGTYTISGGTCDSTGTGYLSPWEY
jgi:hypothetical protein